jgi:hypothetical protein
MNNIFIENINGSYEEGVIAGKSAAYTILKPINTGGHTESFYLYASELYKKCIFSEKPTRWMEGFGDGFDTVCIENRNKRSNHG